MAQAEATVNVESLEVQLAAERAQARTDIAEAKRAAEESAYAASAAR